MSTYFYILKQRFGEWPPFFQIGTDMGEWDLLGTPPRGQVVAAASARCAVLTVVHMVEFTDVASVFTDDDGRRRCRRRTRTPRLKVSFMNFAATSSAPL